MSETTENAAPTPSEVAPAPTYTPEERVYIDTRGGEIEPKPVASEVPPPDAGEGDKAQEAKEPEERKLVDLRALQEARSEIKELKEFKRQAEINQARWDERFRMAMPKQGAPQPPPKPDEDIFGAVNYQGQAINHIAQKINQYEQQIAAQGQMKQLADWAQSQEAEFKKENADYDNALKHLRETRANELRSVWGLNDAAVNNALIDEERQILMAAARMGRNPAELAYNSAKQRGYQKGAAKASSAEEMSTKLNTIEEGQKASKSLSNVGGKAGGGEVSMEQVLKMPDDEFGAWKTKNYAKWRRMKGAEY